MKDAVEKLSLSDSALQFEPENSPVLGFGVRIAFLGLLHMDIVRERVVFYDGSMGEWARDPSLPIETDTEKS